MCIRDSHLIEQGECWVTFAGKQFHLNKGDLFFLPQNRPHFLASSQQKRENSLQRAQSNALFNVHQIAVSYTHLKDSIPSLAKRGRGDLAEVKTKKIIK